MDLIAKFGPQFVALSLASFMLFGLLSLKLSLVRTETQVNMWIHSILTFVIWFVGLALVYLCVTSFFSLV